MRAISTLVLHLALVFGLAGLSGCGGGSGGDIPPPSSTDATLSALKVSTGAMAPFAPEVTTYSVSVGLLEANCSVTPTAADAGASISVNGVPVDSGAASADVALAVGVTPIMIVVTAADGEATETYTVVVTRTSVAVHEGGYLKASNAESSDFFGYSVAISGDTLVVGAVTEDSSVLGGESDNSESDAGAVYVFVRTGSTWTQQAFLKASNAESDDGFGCAVSITGNTLVVGAFQEDSSAVDGEQDNSESNSGAAYVFVRGGATWTQQAFLKASNAQSGDWFGSSIAISGDTVVVGAYLEESVGAESDNSATGAGAAYVFERVEARWSQTAYLKASNVGSGDNFGISVAISGSTIAVGAIGEGSGVGGGEADDSEAFAGAAYVFVRARGTWVQQAYLKASNAEGGDFFGSSVAVSGDTVVVSAYGEDSGAAGGEADNSAIGSGAAYVFQRTGTSWVQQAFLKASNAEERDGFSRSLAIEGDALVVTAWSEDSSASGGEADNSETSAGAAYVFIRTGATWTQQPYLKAPNAEERDTFGYAVAMSENTIVVSAFTEDSSAVGGGADNSTEDAGAVYVLR